MHCILWRPSYTRFGRVLEGCGTGSTNPPAMPQAPVQQPACVEYPQFARGVHRSHHIPRRFLMNLRCQSWCRSGMEEDRYPTSRTFGVCFYIVDKNALLISVLCVIGTTPCTPVGTQVEYQARSALSDVAFVRNRCETLGRLLSYKYLRDGAHQPQVSSPESQVATSSRRESLSQPIDRTH